MDQEVKRRMPVIGETVIWHESDGRPLNALVTAVWTETCINLVIVAADENRKDEYGRQIERRTSCPHKHSMAVHGFYWRFQDEEPNPYTPPLQS